MSLLTYDEDGEPWLDNPQLILANPRSKGGTLARRKRKSRSLRDVSFLFRPRRKKGHKHTMRTNRKKSHRTRMKFHARRRRYSKAMRMMTGHRYGYNPHRKRHWRKHYRNNPRREGLGGIMLPFGLRAPALKDVAFGALGLFVPDYLTSRIMPYVPASFQGNQIVTWVVKIASVLVPGMLIRRFVDSRAGYAFMIGGAASLVIDAIKTFVPSVATMFGLGYQPLLGYYPGGVTTGMGDYSVNTNVRKFRQQPQTTTPILLGVPDRLNPAGRF